MRYWRIWNHGDHKRVEGEELGEHEDSVLVVEKEEFDNLLKRYDRLQMDITLLKADHSKEIEKLKNPPKEKKK